MEKLRVRAWALPCAVVLAWLSGAPAFAQQAGSGTLTGTVVDSTGAALPGVTASATELATGLVRTNVSSQVGVFRIAALPPGSYTLKVELSGFKAVTVKDITLLATEVRDLGKLTLDVGQQTEEVTVTANVTPVQVATSSRYGSITSDQLTNIQMKGRDIYGLLAIVPGVMDTNLNRDFTTWTSMRDVTINGNPVTSKNVVVDGMSVVDEGGTGNAFVNPNIDAIGEVQVIANGYTAENGRNNGGLIQMTTKSGTNRFSGSAWYNARRDRWNSNDYFRKVQNLPKPLYRVNIPGYSIGGPVIIPSVMDSRKDEKKLFFFGSQEFTDDAKPSGVTRSNLPTALERAGDFSQTRITNGTIQQIIDPETGQAFPGNIIPANRINPLGAAMLNLLPQPNGVLNPQPGQEWTSNSAFEQHPLHSRTEHMFKLDAVWSRRVRGRFTLIRDREDNISDNQFAPGVGVVNNFVPGWTYSAGSTQVLRPNIVNEMTGGFGHNNYGFKGEYDYTQYYQDALGIHPPRLEPFGPYQDPPAISKHQADEYPYVPIMSFGGGNRSGLATYSPGAVNGRVMPTANRNDRWSFQDDLSITHNRHNFKFGVYTEYTLKTEPQSVDYMGNFNFGHSNDNNLSTGNGYANALLGVYQTYTELSDRVDKDRRHWQTEGYLQDSWRMSSRFTLDAGVRLTHSGAFFEVNHANTGFDPNLYDPTIAPRLYRPICTTGAPGNASCPNASQKAYDPANKGLLFPFTYQGNIVPGSGQQVNGVIIDGLPGKKQGQYYDYTYLVAAPRVGFAWDLTGDGKTALRSSWGIFYNYPRGGYSFETAGPPIVYNRIIRWGRFDDIANASTAGTQFVESPITGNVVGGTRGLDKSYNVNVAFQRDVGFNTAVEAAYVGNFSYVAGRTVDVNAPPLFAFADPNNLFNNAALNSNFLRTNFPGMGAINQYFPGLAAQTLKYNALQLNANRRLSKGLTLGAAYTLSKGEGYTGYDQYTDQLGGEEALRARYWGPTDVDRRHNIVFNYSYLIPSVAPHNKVLNAIVSDWQLSGVTKFLSGTAVTPSCSSTNTGITNTTPSLTPTVTARCMLVGDPNAFTPDTSLPFPDQAHFNTAAFAYAAPISATAGNFGNTPTGILRNPSYSNWDVTLARRFPIPALGRNAQFRLQIQAYNIFNQVQFLNLGATYQFTGAGNLTNNNADTGKYVWPNGQAYGTTPPRQIGITTRLDF
jgi:outer membrane receptor protein involved in Fe transport